MCNRIYGIEEQNWKKKLQENIKSLSLAIDQRYIQIATYQMFLR